MREGWPTQKLGDLADKITDGTHNSPPYVENGVPMLDAKHVKDGFVIDDSEPEKFISPATDVLLAKRCKPRTGDILISSRGSIGKIALVGEAQDFNIMGNMILIRLPVGVTRRFVAYYLHSQVANITSIAQGVAQKGLYLRQIRNYEIPLPPLPEQQRIVAILDEAFAGIATAVANTEKNLANARELFESYLNAVFTQKGVGWEIKPLGSLSDFVRGPFGGSLKKSCFKPSGYVVYEQQHAIHNQFDNVRYFIDEEKFQGMRRFELSSGDLIMSCSGTMGKVAIVPKGIAPGIINQALLKLTPTKSISAEFLKFWMESLNFQEELAKLSQGVAIKNVVSVKVLKEIQIPLPPLPEQKRIVSRLNALSSETQRLQSLYQHKLTTLAELKQSILHKAFSGELTAQPARALQEAVA